MQGVLQQRGVELAPVHLDECARFGLELPALPGWDLVPAHLFPHATAVLCSPTDAVDGFVPNAAVLTGKVDAVHSIRRPCWHVGSATPGHFRNGSTSATTVTRSAVYRPFRLRVGTSGTVGRCSLGPGMSWSTTSSTSTSSN